jgi:intracellular sulfur oxidation DsrE/DsrF family protein
MADKIKTKSKNPKEVKVVWDVTIGNDALFEDRMGLIQQAADVIRKNGMSPRFVIVIHGPATKFATRSLHGTKFESEKIERLPDIRKIISKMNKDNMTFIQCQVPMTRNNVSEDNLLPFISVSETVFYDLAILQMKGYAYIPINEM